MTKELRFDGRVAVVTGAGGGLGRAHALLLAGRGAKVVVNDLGGAMTGGGKNSAAADAVVASIREAGGEAVANYDSVEDGAAIVQTAMDTYGRVDILVNNAGILRDKSFHKMTEEDWELVYRVHVLGAFRVTHAVWPIMREQQYGRIVMTASAAGIYGNFGQANYSMAKLGLAGFANTLAVEGRTKNIHANTIAPLAGSRLTETVMPKDLVDALKPEYVSPLVAYLCHEDTAETGGIYEVGGGFFGKLRWERAAGHMLRLGRTITPENVRDAWDGVAGFDETTHPADVMQSMQPIVDNVNAGPSQGGNEFIDVDLALGYEFPPLTSEYDERDVALYALGVGAAADPAGADLPLVYELHSDGFKALPTFGVVPAVSAFLDAAKDGMLAPGLNYGLDRILHGEQHTELLRPLPRKAKLTHRATVKEILDKGKNALVNIEMRTSDETGEELVINNLIMVVRGAGGWGGSRGSGDKAELPSGPPDKIVEERTAENQALLYRLSGDWNPLHADENFAKAFGFERPILHGLCTLGFAARHVVNTYSNGDPRLTKKVRVRMSGTVFPGETLVTEMWKLSDQTIAFRTKVLERDTVALSHGVLELHAELPSAKSKTRELPPMLDETATSSSDLTVVPGSRDVFAAIRRYVESNPDLATKAQAVFRFVLTNPDGAWTVDLKNGSGSVREGSDGDANTTLTLTDADFLRMCTGELDAQEMFMKGQMKIGGDVMAAMKLEFLKKLDPAWVFEAASERLGDASAAEVPSSAAKDAAPTSWDIFVAIEDHVSKHAELVSKIGTVYRFELTNPDGVWTLDLKTGPGTVVEGEGATPDTTLVLTDDDFIGMASGSLNPQKLFMDGRLKISGNLMASQKLDFLQKIDPEAARTAVIDARRSGRGPSAGAPSAPAEPPVVSRVPELVEVLARRLAANEALADEVRATIQFLVTEPEGAFLVDSREAPARAAEGSIEAPDATLTATEETLLGLLDGSTNARDVYQRGQLRVDGDVGVAQRLWFLR